METCQVSAGHGDQMSFFWIWLVLGLMMTSWIVFGVRAYFWLKTLHIDLYSCWNQVAAEDAYVDEQEKRITDLFSQHNQLGTEVQQLAAIHTDRIEEVANEVSMTHDYASGIHYSMVEHGGFLRNATGLSHEQWIHLHTLERANLLSSRTAGAEEFMNLVRQRYAPRGPSDDTDMEGEEEETQSEEEPDYGPFGHGAVRLEAMCEFLKKEHTLCLERGDYWDANSIQNAILMFLDEVRNGGTAAEIHARARNRVSELFKEMFEKATNRNHWSTADRYNSISITYAQPVASGGLPAATSASTAHG